MDKHRRGELTDRFVSVVDQLNRLMSGGNWVRLRILDLNVHHVNTLQVLNQNGPLRMSTIADHLGSTQSHATNVVKKLVDRKYLNRKSDPDDRRVVICEITAMGKLIADRYMELVTQRATSMAEVWDEEQLESVVACLELFCRDGAASRDRSGSGSG
ncbi:MAG: MarR family transcriptional regulator [Gemmatimonadota bacterium]|nr:MarR family transcriptional regulator [Gemmatimonadota bacterium]MXW06525.1 MarR family transcriptional regulator [Gemmatimonadota bacterium]MYB61381.1 MarR family transcriptional regulator [Gemmatimonadota bacterium]